MKPFVWLGAAVSDIRRASPGRKRDLAVLAMAAFAAAASNLAAVHAAGWSSLSRGFPLTPMDLALGGISAATDAMAAAYLAACLLVVQRPNRLAGVLSAALAAAPIACSAAKLTVVGVPAFFDDVLLLGDLVRATDPVAAAVAACLAFAAAGAFACNIRPAQPRRVLLAFSPLLFIGAATIAAHHSPALSARLAALIPTKVSEFPADGHFINALAELAASTDRRHGMEAVRGSAQPLPSSLHRADVPPLERRNVHLIMVEGFIDPAWLKSFAFSPEPLAPLFVRWRDQDGSTSVVPVFGNRSANTEFEVMCGLPATVGPSEVVFRLIPAGSELPCLPRLLAARGFRTMGTKANSPDFYNARPAFAAVGFERRVFSPDLDMSDLDGVWLSAEATLRQIESRAKALAAEGGGAPVLNYVFVGSGHHPYARDKARRPDRVSVSPEDPVVRDYVNGAYYNAAEVEAFVGRIAAADPRALVVVLGDHQPLLGPNYKGYRDGGRLPVKDVPPLHQASMFETPLLVLDAGEAVPVGRLPAYLLPEIILDRLSGGEHCRRNACAHQEAWRLRPFRDHTIEVEAHGRGERLCPAKPGPGATAPCADAVARSKAWEAALLRALDPARRTALAGGGGGG